MKTCKRLLIGMLGVLTLLLCPFSVMADEFALSAVDVQTRSCVDWYQTGGVYYLFLPAGWVERDVRISVGGADTFELDGETIQSGENVDCFPIGQVVTVKNGEDTYQTCAMQSSEIAAVFMKTESGTLDYIEDKKGNKEEGDLVYFSGIGEVVYNDEMDYIKSRGNASFNFLKKSYTVKLDEKVSLGGMEESKKWVFVSNYRDKSLLRNWVTMDMARASGLAYTPECEMVDVYINGDYRGNYMLSEHIDIGDGRVEIRDLEEITEDLNEKDLEEYESGGPKKRQKGKYKWFDIPVDSTDITGGYLLEYEAYPVRYEQEPSAYGTINGATVVVKNPKYASKNQMEYITTLIQSFENAIYSSKGIDKGTGKHYTEIADMDSLVRKFLIEEVSKNYDGNTSSQFFYKPAGEDALLYAGPVWDYDSAYGSYAREAGMGVLKPKNLFIGSSSLKKHWWPKLYAKKDFAQETARVYTEVFSPLLSQLIGEVQGDEMLSLAEYASIIEASAEMNAIRWPFNTKLDSGVKRDRTFLGNVDILRTFISERKAYLDKLWQ